MVRMTKRRSMSIWERLQFHVEPSYTDKQYCDNGQMYGEHACKQFSAALENARWQDPLDPPFTVENTTGWMRGCFMDIGSGGWKVIYNVNPEPFPDKDHSSKRLRVCSGHVAEQSTFYQMGTEGESGCGYPLRLTKNECAVAGMQVLIGSGKPFKQMQTGRDEPPGCRLRWREGGWKITWNPPGWEGGSHDQHYPICPTAIHVPPNGTSMLMERARLSSNTGCDVLRNGYCPGCGCRCGSRRRQACWWWRDSVCCANPGCGVDT